MMITWQGDRCSDGCPFYEVSIAVDGGVKFHSPKCRLSGFKDESRIVLDIRPKLKNGHGQDCYCEKATNCPFVDVHSIHVEVHNIEAPSKKQRSLDMGRFQT